MSAQEPPPGTVLGGIHVFISYRRKDTAGHAGRLYDTLRARMEAPEIFMDIEAIEAGVDFVDVIHEAVGKCDVLLALIGPDWLTLKNDAGDRRIDERGDFVRIEIEAALTRDVRVIPVLVDGGRMPPIGQLPASLAAFGRRHALEISDARWGFDVGRLVDSIEKIAVANADEAARVAAAVVAAEATREAADAEEARLAAESTAVEEARVAEEARFAEEARLALVAATAAEANTASLAAQATAAEESRVAAAAMAAEEARLAGEATAAAAIGSTETAISIDPDAPTGSWPITDTTGPGAERPPVRRGLPRFAVPVAAVLVIAVGLGTVVFGSGLLGGGGGATPSPTEEARVSLPVPSGVYVAVAGDTLASIASRFGVTTSALALANPNLSVLEVLAGGQIVVVPRVIEPDPTPESTSSPSESIAPSPSAPPSGPPPSKAPFPAPTSQPPSAKDTTPPSSPKVTIAGDPVFSKTVDLTLSATGATQMRIGNFVSGSCDWTDWRAYAKTFKKWPISGTSGGTRTVCAEFRDSASPPNSSAIAKGSTYYDRKPYDSLGPGGGFGGPGNDFITFGYNCTWYIFVLDDDKDADGDSLEITGLTQPSVGGSVSVRTSASRPGDDVLYYSPPTNFGGTDDFTYTVSDGHGGTAVVNVYVQMNSALAAC